MSKSEKIKTAVKMVIQDNESSFFADEYSFVKKILNRKRVIILSEQHLIYFSKNGSMKKFNVHRLTSIGSDKKQMIIEFKYHKPIKILLSKETEESLQKFTKTLYLVIQHLMSDSELEKINFNFDSENNAKFSPSTKLVSLPTFYGSFCRFELSIQDLLFQPEQKDEVKIRFYLLFHRKLVDFSSFKNKNNASRFLFEVIPLCPSTKYISIIQFDELNIYKVLDNFFSCLTAMESISINGKVNDYNDELSFANFMNQIKTNLNSKMVGLTFSNSEFTNNHLDLLKDVIIAKNIQAIEFHNAFSDKTVFSYFVSTFLPSISPCNDFTSLSLEDIEAAPEFEQLIRNIPKQVKSLSIENCEIPVNQVLKTINSHSNNLTVLNLSHNAIDTYQNFSRMDMKFHIPQFLTVLILDYVTFSFGSIIPFLTSLFTEIKSGAELSLAHMIMSDSDFDKVDDTFTLLVANKKFSLLKSLKWDFNPITPSFLDFLRDQKNLSAISISGCFSPKDAVCFDEFCEFVSKSGSLEKLVCRRFEQISLESLTPRLIQAVASSKINVLDISNSKGGSTCYQSLKELITLRDDENAQKLKCLIYDGLEPNDKDELSDFIKFVKEHNCTFVCSFPIHDIEYLYKNHQIGFFEISQIISLCQIETKSDYIRPFFVFFNESQSSYPFYFKDECRSVRAGPEQSETSVVDWKPFDEVNPNFLFGEYYDELNRNSYTKKSHFMFSFKSDEINVNAGKSKRNTSVVQMKKHPNKKTVKNIQCYISNDSTQKLANDYFTVCMDMIEPPPKADIDDAVPIQEAPVMPESAKTPEKDDFTLDEDDFTLDKDDWTPKNKTQTPQKKPTPVSLFSGSDDEDYSYDYSSEIEVKIPVVRKSGDFKGKGPVKPLSPMAPTINRKTPNFSPKRPGPPTMGAKSPMQTITLSSSDESYSYEEL